MPSMDTSSTSDSLASNSPSGRSLVSSSSVTGGAGRVSVGGVMDKGSHIIGGAARRAGKLKPVTASLLPPGVTSPAALGEGLLTSGYLADPGLAAASYLAIAMGRPLLLEG